jgi:peptidoglycan hydrolase-like amidase
MSNGSSTNARETKWGSPLPSLRSQKPTWNKAAALARNWELNQLAKRLEEFAAV